MESITDKDRKSQPSLLKTAGAERVYIEKALRPKEQMQFRVLASLLKAGDTLVIWKLSGMSYSMKDLSLKIRTLLEKGTGLICHTENRVIVPEKLLVMSKILDVLVMNDYIINRERTLEGLEAARAKGRTGGKKSSMSIAVAKKKCLLAQGMILFIKKGTKLRGDMNFD